MSGAASPFTGSFAREVGATAIPGDGKLTHLASDSIVIQYTNPLTSQSVRKAYPYVDLKNEAIMQPHNTVAKTTLASAPLIGQHFVIAGAPNIQVTSQTPTAVCCEVVPGNLNAANPDSASYIGMILEASREFKVEMSIFTNFGQFVDQVSFSVPREQFLKLTTVPGKKSRTMRLLWKGITHTGARAGTGAYIFHTRMSLLPVPGLPVTTKTTSSYMTMGLVRN
jgi:hypothetical protein